MLGGSQAPDFDAFQRKYTPEEHRLFSNITSAIESGKKNEAAQLVEALDEAEGARFAAYLEDCTAINQYRASLVSQHKALASKEAGLHDHLAVLDKQSEAITHKYANQAKSADEGFRASATQGTPSAKPKARNGNGGCSIM
jgi:hypothetical protein